jgi:tRNA U34 5-methylaminomethyl-2-thiouridine-forming methyltransferase MnmC
MRHGISYFVPRISYLFLFPMNRQIQLTADGSHTIAIPEQNLSYHSHHGAVQESMHVFIQAGLLPMMDKTNDQPLHILEIGLGTGLNALLSLREAVKHQQQILYTGLEKYPLTEQEASQLNHGQLLSMEEQFTQLHTAAWEEKIQIDPYFILEKRKVSLPAAVHIEPIHLVYFDAFAPTEQPELWTAEFFQSLYELILPGGLLVTYSSKSEVRRAMVSAGFRVKKIPGPRGKREMVQAWK